MIRQENNNAFSFSLRVWFLTITLSFLFLIFSEKWPNEPNLLTVLISLLYLNFILLLFTIPILFIFYSLNIFLFKTIKNKFHLKLTINLFVAFGYFIIFLFCYFDLKILIFPLITTALIWKIKIINKFKIYHDDIIDIN